MAQEDLDSLLNSLIPFAQEMLSQHGEFYAFAAIIDLKGEVSLVSMEDEAEAEYPDDDDLIELFTGALREKAAEGEIRATGICVNVKVIPPDQEEEVDAICAILEHNSGEAIDGFLPYTHSGDEFEYGELFAGAGEQKIFAS